MLQVGSSKGRSAEYAELLCTLDCCAAAEIDAVLKEMQPLTEPHVARELSKVLPQGSPGYSCQHPALLFIDPTLVHL